MTAIADLFRVPKFGLSFVHVFERNLLFFRYHFFSSSLVMFVEPIVFFWALAFGVGHYVGPIGGMDYVEYLVPGVMLATAMVISYTECSHNCYLKITENHRYSNFVYTPISMSDVAIGEILWGTFKGTLSGFMLGLIAFLQGYLRPEDLLPALVILVITSAMFSALGLLIMTTARNFETFNFAQVLFILPMYLLSGALFPLDALPNQYTQVSMVFPLTHSLMFLRSSMIDIYDMQYYIHFGIVFVSTLCLFNLSVARFNKRFRR